MAQVPERLVNYRVYSGAGSLELLGTSDVELPKFDAMTESIAGAGIAGEIDSVVLGHFKSMTLKLKFLVPTKQAILLAAPQVQSIDIRGSTQQQDPMLGALATSPFRVTARGMVKQFDLGKFEPGKRMDSAIEIEIIAISVFQDGVELVALDKLNLSFKVLGVDYLQSVRVDMGGV